MKIDLLKFPKIHRVLGTRTEEHRVIARRFDKEFFDGSRDTGYGGYVNDGRWNAVAERLVRHYKLSDRNRVLDVGCAKGFLVHALRKLRIEAYGLDVSGYALAEADPFTNQYLMHRSATEIPHIKFALIISINTLHNLERDEIVRVLRHMQRAASHNYITVDAYRTDEERDRMFAWNLTAKTILHVDDWLALFKEAGYTGDYDWWMP